MTDLQLDWCSHKAANFACENWHYSECMPAFKTLKIGVWENEKFIGCVIYSRGANHNIGGPFNLDQTEVCELTRVALDDHDTHVSRILSISRKLLLDKSPGISLVVSYADPQQDHEGGIYQADNWYYLSRTQPTTQQKVNGETMHKRTVFDKFGTNKIDKIRSMSGVRSAENVSLEGKHKYVYPLTKDIEQKVKTMSKPYP